MQYYIQKLTTSTDGSVDVEKVKLGGLDLFPHYNHAFYELCKLDKTIKFNEKQLLTVSKRGGSLAPNPNTDIPLLESILIKFLIKKSKHVLYSSL